MRMIEFIAKSIEDTVVKRNEGINLISTQIKQFYNEYDFACSFSYELTKNTGKDNENRNVEVFHECPVNFKPSLLLCLKSELHCRPVDITIKNNNKIYPIELKYSCGSDYGTDEISAGFGYDIKKITDIVNNSENVEYGYCVLLIKKKTNNIKTDIEEKISSLKEKIDLDNKIIKWTMPLKDCTYPLVYENITNFHYLIIEISKQNTEKIISK